MSDNARHARKSGRPRKTDPPRVPYDELDRLLVFGEVVTCEDGESTTVQYPSYRELARRFEVSHSLIAQYAKKHNCMRRREEAQARIAAKADERLVDLRATALAVSKDDALRIIDRYLAGFEQAILDGRVRFDDPNDFDTMLRLKEFLQGGADSRQEVHTSLSLEEIQARHRRMLKQVEATSPAMRGEIGPPVAIARTTADQAQAENSPQRAIAQTDSSAGSSTTEASGPHGDSAPDSAPGPSAAGPAASPAMTGNHAAEAPSGPPAGAGRSGEDAP